MAKNCPVCEKDDEIRKVSSIVASEQRTGTSTSKTIGVASVGGDLALGTAKTNKKTTSTTALAASLAPPLRPKMPKTMGAIIFVGGTLLAFYSLFAIITNYQNLLDTWFYYVILFGWLFILRADYNKKRKSSNQVIETEIPICGWCTLESQGLP